MLICHYFDQCRKPTLNQMVKPKIPRESGLDIRNNPNFHPTKTRKSKTFKTEWHEQKRCSVSSCFTILPQMLERSALPRTGVLKKKQGHHITSRRSFSWISPKKNMRKTTPPEFTPKLWKSIWKTWGSRPFHATAPEFFRKFPGIKTVGNKKSWGFVMSLDVVGLDNFRDCASVTTKFRLTPPKEKVLKKWYKFNKIHNPFNPLDMISSKCQFHMARKTPRMWTKISTSVLGNGAEG